MNTKLIVIAGILCLPMSVAFADMNNSNTVPNNTDGTSINQPLDKTSHPSTGAKRHYDSNMRRAHQMNTQGTRNVTDGVPVKQTPNDVPIKQPSDLNPSHPSTTN